MNRQATASDHGWRNSAIHRDVDNRNARWVFKFILAVAVAATPLVVYLLQTMSYVQTGYALEAARGHEAQLIEQEHRLTIDRDILESLPEVEKQSSVLTGLERAPAAHVVVVTPGEIGREAPSRETSYRPPSR